eukprot:gene34137-41323_t
MLVGCRLLFQILLFVILQNTSGLKSWSTRKNRYLPQLSLKSSENSDECAVLPKFNSATKGFSDYTDVEITKEVFVQNRQFLRDASSDQILSIMSQLAAAKTHRSTLQLTTEIRSFLSEVIDEFSGRKDNHSKLLRMVTLICRVGLPWKDIVAKPNIELILEAEVAQVDADTLVDFLSAMSMSGARASTIKFKVTLMKKLAETMPRMSAFNLVRSLNSLALVSFSWQQFPVALRRQIMNKLVSISSQLSSSQGSTLIWSLGMMGVSKYDITLSQLKALLNSVGYSLGTSSEVVACLGQCLEGVVKIRLDLTRANLSTRRLLVDMVLRLLQQSKDIKDTDNAIQVLSSFDVAIDDLPPDCRELVPRAISSCLPYCSARFLVYKVINLSRLRFLWPSLPDEAQQGIFSAITRLHKSFQPLDVSSLILFLAELQVPLDSLPSNVSTALFYSLRRNLPKMNSIDLTKSIMGLNSGGVAWKSISPSLRWAIKDAVEAQQRELTVRQVANIAFCVATMCFDAENQTERVLRELDGVMLDSILKHDQYLQQTMQESADGQGAGSSDMVVKYADLRQVQMFVRYLTTTKHVEIVEKIPPYLMGNLANTQGDEGWEYGSSKLQHSIVASLLDAKASMPEMSGYEIREEFSCFGGMMPVDIAVVKKKNIIALIEVDGPHHERSNGQFRRTDLFKQYIYGKTYPHALFHRVSYKDEKMLGTAVISKQIVELMLDHDRAHEKVIPSQTLVRGVLRIFQDIGSWGTRLAKAVVTTGDPRK